MEVLMERSACVARQKSTQELERPRGSLHDAIPAVEFEDPSKPCLDNLSKPAGVPWESIVECCASLGNVGKVGDGEVDGVSKFGSEEQAKRVQEEFAPITRFFVETASELLGDVGKEHGWFIALLKTQKESRWHHSGRRRLCAHAQACEWWRRITLCDNYAIDINATVSEKSVIRNSFFCHIWSNIFISAAFASWTRRSRSRRKVCGC